jgi:hypothetical protein
VRYRKPLRTTAFIASLAAWPIAIYTSKWHFPETLGPITLAWFAFVVVCATVLRSWMIKGAILSIIAAVVVTSSDPESDSTPVIFMLCVVVGILGAWSCQAAIGSRKPPV